jgi:GAF domain-containing protein
MPTRVVHAIDRLTHAIGSSQRLSDIYAAALEAVRLSLDIDRAAILTFDGDGVLRFKAWSGISAEYRAAVEGHTPWQPGSPAPEPVLVDDVQSDETLTRYRDAFSRERIGSLAFVPLASEGGVVGKLML